jgi:hypothetical protein
MPFSWREAGVVAAVDRLELVEHPQHVLAGGHDVGGGDVGDGADVAGELAHTTAADPTSNPPNRLEVRLLGDIKLLV